MTALSTTQLHSQLQALLKGKAPDLIALDSEAEFDEPEIECNGRVYLVRRARSVLEFHHHLEQAQGNPLLCLTSLKNHELGLDLTARLYKRRVLSVPQWETVKHLFDCQSIESSLLSEAHLVDYLLSSQPPGGYTRVQGEVLTADKVWSCLFHYRLGMPADYLDNFSLLKWAAHDCRAYLEAPDDLRRSARARVIGLCGQFGRALLDCVEDGRLDPMALGLALRCLQGEPPDREQERALVRLEQYTGNQPIESKVVADWAQAAEHFYGSTPLSAEITAAKAEKILHDLQITSHLERSDYLPGGFRLRAQKLESLLSRALSESLEISALEDHLPSLLAHRSLSEPHRASLLMVPRLLRFLRTAGPQPSASLDSLAELYRESTAYAAWARLRVESLLSVGELKASVGQLVDRVTERLEHEARLFAHALAAWNSAGEPPGALWKVEEVIDRVLVPVLAAGSRFLVVVLDGCGWPTMHELMESFASGNWKKMRPEGSPLPSALATYPSVTECSRASLLSGRLERGPSAVEKQNFRDHPGLKQSCNRSYPPYLVHKAELVGEHHQGVSHDVELRIRETRNKAVAVVINAIDDHLERHDQIATAWTSQTVAFFAELAGLAQASGRVLVLLSDHGHVLERGGELQAQESGGGARWRPGSDAGPGEVVLSGPRVMIEEGSVVVPWSETIRYTKKKAGYHGGCHPGEILTPVLVLCPSNQELTGWTETRDAKPPWWLERRETTPEKPVKKRAAAKKPAAKTGQLTLFEEAGSTTDFARQVLDFPLIAAAWKRHRGEPDRDWAYRLLTILHGHGNKATVEQLSTEFGVAEARFLHLLREASGLLSVDGDYLITITPDNRYVLLNRLTIVSAGSDSEPAEGITLTVNQRGEFLTFRVPFAPLDGLEQKILELLAEYGQLTEEEIAKAVGSRRVGGTMERLMERWTRRGYKNLAVVDQGAGGRRYRLDLEGILL